MPRGPLTFRQRDVTAAVKAVVDAGCAVARVEVDKSGKIIVHTDLARAPAKKPEMAETEHNEWDDV